jgi:hypothetical protein
MGIVKATKEEGITTLPSQFAQTKAEHFTWITLNKNNKDYAVILAVADSLIKQNKAVKAKKQPKIELEEDPIRFQHYIEMTGKN